MKNVDINTLLHSSAYLWYKNNSDRIYILFVTVLAGMAKLADAGDLISMKVYGPYCGKDGRFRCILIKDGIRKTISYPRMIMENHLGRSLGPDEDVHHQDGNIGNNVIQNLKVVRHTEHCRKHSTKYMGCVSSCIYCGKEFSMTARQQRDRESSSRRGKVGPFCSRRCSGMYGTDIQRAHK